MFSVFDIIGVLLRGAAALGFAAFCGWSLPLVETGRQTRRAVLGQGGPMVLIGLSRETRRRPAQKSEDQPGFGRRAG